jgi:hypothetical protein
LWRLFDLEKARTRTGIYGLNEILAEAGCDDHRVVGRAARYLDSLGFLDNFTAMSSNGYPGYIAGLGPRAMRIMEPLPHGTSVMKVLHAPRETPVATTYNGPVIQGVHGSNVAIGSPNAHQALMSGSDLSSVLDSLIAGLKGDPAASEEAVEDAESLKVELERQKPNSRVVMSLLGNLAVVGIAAGYVQQIREALGL